MCAGGEGGGGGAVFLAGHCALCYVIRFCKAVILINANRIPTQRIPLDFLVKFIGSRSDTSPCLGKVAPN